MQCLYCNSKLIVIMRLRYLIIVILILCRIDGFAAKEDITLKLKIKGLKDTICFLGNYFGDKQYLRDTAKINSKGERCL